MDLHGTRFARGAAGCARARLRGRLFGLMCCAGATDAGAQCARAFVPGSAGTHPTVDFGHMVVSATAAIGELIATRMVGLDDARCTRPVGQFNYAMTNGRTALPNVYYTNVAGVGVRVLPGADAGNFAYASFTEHGGTDPYFFRQFRTRVDLVKTGPIGTGTLSGIFYRGTATSPGFGSDIAFSGGTFTAVSCSTSNESVALPTVASTALPHVGATAGATPFNLRFNCAGAAGVSVLVTLGDSSNPANTGDELTLSPASTSAGVRLQILRDGVPIHFGPDSAFPGNHNQFALGNARELRQTALIVRYIRTGIVRPGTVLAMATFTLSYQ
ncbi:fimbrial protein [Lysobacter sp. TAF61]|uniref:fimbrial protein n=1 Tax=Lysobacter sp. TAF61 TaxID=3233072 RepID=UPI003F95B03E